jgi:hypothetical protein
MTMGNPDDLRGSRTRHHRVVPRAIAALPIAFCVAACASSTSDPSPPAPIRVNRVSDGPNQLELYNESGGGARVVDATKSNVWAVLGAVYERLQISVTLCNPAQWEFGNPRCLARRIEGERLSTHFDCGRTMTGPRADEYAVTLSVVTRLADAPGDSTMVVTTVDGSAKPRATSGNAVHCASKGTLEMRVAHLVVEALLESATPR